MMRNAKSESLERGFSPYKPHQLSGRWVREQIDNAVQDLRNHRSSKSEIQFAAMLAHGSSKEIDDSTALELVEELGGVYERLTSTGHFLIVITDPKLRIFRYNNAGKGQRLFRDIALMTERPNFLIDAEDFISPYFHAGAAVVDKRRKYQDKLEVVSERVMLQPETPEVQIVRLGLEKAMKVALLCGHRPVRKA